MRENKKIAVGINSNFHLLYRKEDIEPSDESYKEYRKKWEKNPETFTAGNFPIHLDIESTNLCNLKCPFCTFLTVQEKWKRGLMDFNLYQRIIDEGRTNNLFSIKLSLRGEPLLHPNIIKMIKYAKKSGIIDIYFNTNAVLLSERISEALIESGINRISISFEGTTKEVYEKNRVGAGYGKVVKNIETLILCRERNKVAHPRIRIQTVLIPEMKDELNGYVSFWRERGVDEVAYLDFEQEPESNETLSYPWVCSQLWQRMSIWYDGTILPCVHDTWGLMRFGNVKNLKITDAWNSELEKSCRNLHKNGKGELLYSCKTCPLRAGQVRKLKKERE